MSFIGVVANKKIFENIKNGILEEMDSSSIQFIQINLRSFYVVCVFKTTFFL